jgi:hypothetical protein
MLIDSVTGNTLKLQLLQNIPGTATLTQCTADRWGCAGTSVTPDTNYWDGQLASAAILANCGQTNIAARRCDNLILNGFSDWYLPAVGEMDLLLCQFGLETSGSCKGLICKGISGLPPNMARITHSPEDSTAVTSLSLRTIGTSSPGIKFGR